MRQERYNCRWIAPWSSAELLFVTFGAERWPNQAPISQHHGETCWNTKHSPASCIPHLIQSFYTRFSTNTFSISEAISPWITRKIGRKNLLKDKSGIGIGTGRLAQRFSGPVFRPGDFELSPGRSITKIMLFHCWSPPILYLYMILHIF